MSGSDTRWLPQELILYGWVSLLGSPGILPNGKAMCIGWKSIETLSLVTRIQFYFLELHFCGFVLRKDLMPLIFSNGAKERLSFVLKFSARGQMLISDSHCQSGQRLAGGKDVCGRTANSPLPEGDLGEWGKGADGGSVASPFFGPFQ